MKQKPCKYISQLLDGKWVYKELKSLLMTQIWEIWQKPIIAWKS